MTREKFKSYLEVQKNGSTNMFDVRAVCILSGESWRGKIAWIL